MSDTKSKMYAKLFNAVTDAIEILQNAQAETEEIFINQEDAQVIPLRRLSSIHSNEGGVNTDDIPCSELGE